MQTAAPTPTDAGEEPLGLRERRRRETLREVSDAALDLFERKGVHATTVDEIAKAAGVSPRTFFRYFPTKEDAAFITDVEPSPIHRCTVDAIRAGAPVARALEAGWMQVFGEFDVDPDARARMLRLRQLVQHEPALLAVALRNDAESADALTDAAVDAAGADADVLTARALVTTVAGTVRLAFDEWARRAELGQEASVRDIYLELRRGLARYVEQLGDPV
ncbi:MULTISPECIES: TetR family transcriptional regulator [unclassified Microbacterium]|uniref:TetR family transcriptional regulator n=1 Tax=unclassified Microbacterium TaxID=2609290 RepID=UPI00214C8A55|nr:MULTISPECIES: TetR family transcriptional regulator [unclassified Microbacterium]MCR2786082.1 TetR family transcriptional regulator [Microbacterium sp. zg.B96]MDL5353114.1 TetR family transcriptional regulator [Microbacterium sp. zg-YB36]WIM17016.1 TetR family transcriptional regulator [Microbacterium sp. zg-B96]